MLFPTIIFSIVSLVSAVLALNRFLSLQNQPSWVYTLFVIVAVFIPISIIFLLPIDILSSNDQDGSEAHNVFYLDSKYILFLWKFDYWSAFILMWSLLPFLQEYYRSGKFTTAAKIKDSLKTNLKFQLLVGAIGAAGSIYYFLNFGFKFQIFKSLLIALSHTYSLIFSLWLMSHGLVNIPRRRWNNNISLQNQLDSLYLGLPKLYDDMNDSLYNLKDVCSVIKSAMSLPGLDERPVLKKQITYLSSIIPRDLNLGNHIRSTDYTRADQLSADILSRLHSTFKKELTNYKSSTFEFEKTKSQVLALQDIVDSKHTMNLSFRFSSNTFNNAKLNYIFYLHVIPVINIIFALFLFALSFVIIQSEIFHSTKFSIINQLILSPRISSTGKFFLSIMFLSYMDLSALISLTRIKIFKIYHLFPRHSDPVSVVFFTMYSNRLTIPLSYNYLTLLQTGKIHSNFDDFLGKSINLSVLGEFLNENLPRLIIFPIVLTIFNVWDRIKRKISINDYLSDFGLDEEEASERLGTSERNNKKEIVIKEAKSIIQRELGSVRKRPTALTELYPSEFAPNSDVLAMHNSNIVENSDSSLDYYQQGDSRVLDRLRSIKVTDKMKTITSGLLGKLTNRNTIQLDLPLGSNDDDDESGDDNNNDYDTNDHHDGVL